MLGIISDTHNDEMRALPYIVKDFLRRNVKCIIHCGDLYPKHMKSELFANLPVVCPLTEKQVDKEPFSHPPNDWRFTKPGSRIITIDGTTMYLGHKRFFEFLRGTESKFMETLEIISRDNDGVRYLFGGHTHRQVLIESNLIHCINPGAVEGALWGYEYAFLDPGTGKIVFTRIPPAKPKTNKFKIAVISDSRNISKLNPVFWKKLARKLKEQKVKKIIHCGNLDTDDIGRKELNDFTIFYNLRKDQKNPKFPPSNWILIENEEPIVRIGKYRFCVQHALGGDLMEKSEMDMLKLSFQLIKKYPAIEFILFGLTHQPLLDENEQVQIINPGDVVKSQRFATIELPRNEITFDQIPFDPLPKL